MKPSSSPRPIQIKMQEEKVNTAKDSGDLQHMKDELIGWTKGKPMARKIFW